MPGWVGAGVATPLPGRVVVVDGKAVVVAEVVVTEVVVGDLVVVWDWVVVDVMGVVVVAGSSVMTPIKQYDSPATRSGQVTPGFNILKLSTDSPQLPPKASHVAPLSAVMENSQSTARRDKARPKAMPGASPATRRCISFIFPDLVLGGSGWLGRGREVGNAGVLIPGSKKK
jgi:hypothetical protein